MKTLANTAQCKKTAYNYDRITFQIGQWFFVNYACVLLGTKVQFYCIYKYFCFKYLKRTVVAVWCQLFAYFWIYFFPFARPTTSKERSITSFRARRNVKNIISLKRLVCNKNCLILHTFWWIGVSLRVNILRKTTSVFFY